MIVFLSHIVLICFFDWFFEVFSPTAGGFQFFDNDDVDVEAIFRSAFGGSDRYFFYSFTREEPEWENSYFRSNNYRYTRNQRNQYEDESSSESDSSVSDMRSDRQALGLSVSGPLTLDDVKNAWVFSLFFDPNLWAAC